MVIPRGRTVGGVLGVSPSFSLSRGPKRTAFGVQRSGEMVPGADIDVGVFESRDSGIDSDLRMSGIWSEFGVCVESTIRIVVEESVDGSVDAKSEFEVPMLESGETGILGMPALKMPFLTHGRTVYFRCGISGTESAQTKRKNNNSVGLCSTTFRWLRLLFLCFFLVRRLVRWDIFLLFLGWVSGGGSGGGSLFIGFGLRSRSQ